MLSAEPNLELGIPCLEDGGRQQQDGPAVAADQPIGVDVAFAFVLLYLGIAVYHTAKSYPPLGAQGNSLGRALFHSS